MLRNDGTVFWAHMETTVVKGLLPNSEQDSSEALVSRIVLIDISKRKQAQDDTLKIEAMNRQFQKSETPWQSWPEASPTTSTTNSRPS